MPSLICFRALGSLELTRGSRPLALARRHKRLAVFSRLALSGESFQSRDVVQATFWPESDQGRARHSLNATLYLLRQELGAGVVVSRGADEIGIAPDRVWSDVSAFEEMLLAKDYARALDLYRGDLLPGFFVPGASDFERWLDKERERLRRAANEAACGHAERAAEHGNWMEAAKWARRVASVAFDDEIVVRRSIRLLDHVGDRAGALELFERFSRHLKEEYGAQAAPETERLIVEVRRRIDSAPSSPEALEARRESGGKKIGALLPSSPTPSSHRDSPPAPLSSGGSGASATALRDSPSSRTGFRLRSLFKGRRLIAAMILSACTASGIWLTGHLDADGRYLTTQAVDRPGIVISPFQNLGTIPELEYLAQAITAALTGQLAEVEAIELIAEETYAAAGWTGPSTIRRRRHESQPVFLVRGNVLPSRQRTRVSISLIDGRTGAILRTATVERRTENAFDLIDQVARELGRLLRSEVGHEIRLRRWRASTTNPRAWQLQKRAEVERQRAKKLAEGGSVTAAAAKLQEADSLLAMAEAEDPTWDAPTVWRARVASDAAWLSFLPPINDTIQARRWVRIGLAYADQVLKRDSTHAVALELGGTFHYWSYLFAPPSEVDAVASLRRAEADLRRAVAIDRTRAHAWNLLSAILYSRGDFSESYLAAQHAYSADAYLEAREETLLRLAETAYEIGRDSVAWHWCSIVDAHTPRGAYCRLSLLAWGAGPGTLAPRDPWAILHQVSENTAVAESMQALLMMRVATVLARRDLADSAKALITRARERAPHRQGLDLLEAEARFALGETEAAAALLRRYVTAHPGEEGVIESRRFAALRSLIRDLVLERRQ